MKSAMVGNVKTKSDRKSFFSKEERSTWHLSTKSVSRVTQKREGTSEVRAEGLSSAIGVMAGAMDGENVPLQKT